MNVSKDHWQEKLNNLNKRRLKEVIKSNYPQVDDYNSHIHKCHIGSSALDVGCGLQIIKQHLPPHVAYTGIDPSMMVDGTINMTIEDCNFPDESFDTVYCFATLDGVQDLELTARHMKRVCKDNIVLLTGIDINPDQFHTFNITLEVLDKLFGDMKVGYKEWITNKVLLIEYLK